MSLAYRLSCDLDDSRYIVAAYSARSRVKVDFSDSVDMTKQSFKDECDINNILSRYQRTGVLDFVSKHAPRFGDATAPDFQQSLNVVIAGQAMFDDLPSSLRRRFGNDPSQFMEFVADPGNDAEAIRLGLKVAPAPSEPPVIPEASAKVAGAPVAP